MKLRDYQEQAVDFLYERNRAMVLAPMGAGKTAIALTAMKEMLRDGHAQRFLVVAPLRVAQHVWQAERDKWAPGLSLHLCLGSPQARMKALTRHSSIMVINYENLGWLASQDMRGFDAVVFDELTRLKNPSGVRFKAFFKAMDNLRVRWGLTGSFTSNGLEDVFGQCKIIDEKLLGRAKGAFLQQYFVCVNRDFGDWAPRPKALEAVMARIKPATFLLEPGEYKDKLPPAHVVEMRCDLPDRAPYEKLKRDLLLELPAAKITATSAGVVTSKLQQMSAGFVYETVKTADPSRPGKFVVEQTPHWLSTHKLDLLEEVLEGNQRANTLIWYSFVEERQELLRRYPHAATLDTPNVVEDWNAGKIPLLLAHPQSAGHGLNLQGQQHMVFFSLPWSLELYEQAVGRLHRSGQLKDVWVYVLLTNKTVDEKIWSALHDKRAISEIALEALK